MVVVGVSVVQGWAVLKYMCRVSARAANSRRSDRRYVEGGSGCQSALPTDRLRLACPPLFLADRGAGIAVLGNE